MTTGPRCHECDAPLVEAGGGWSCPEPDCPKYGVTMLRICADPPDENGDYTLEWMAT